MTDPVAAREAASKDYWDIVFAQVRKRRLAMGALALLVLLYAAAIYAPFLANDRPLYLEAIDYGAYEKARRTLYPITINLTNLIADGADAHAASGSPQAYDEALAGERQAILVRVGTMRSHLASEHQGLLDEVEAAVTRAVDLARAGSVDEAVATAEQMKDLAKRVRSELEAAGLDEAPVPGESVGLQPVASYPALEVITRGEIYFMGLWALVMLAPLWNRAVNRFVLGDDRERIRGARRPKALATVLLPAVVCFAFDAREPSFDVSLYKQGLSKGEIHATDVVFAPIAFGYAESHPEEFLRPPTWSREAWIDEVGYYEHGPRKPLADTQTGYMPPPRPVEVRVGEPPRNAPVRHPLGTDSIGRDLLARMVWGGRVSLSVGLVSTALLVFIGVIIGAIAGYFGGWADTLISRVIEIVQCFPVFFLILILVAFVGPSILNIMVIIGIVRWTGVARLVRGEFIRLREQDFVVASRALGVSSSRTIFRHVLPNAMGPVLVAATFGVAAGILTESAMSFLGLGIKAPIPSWGSLLTESRSTVDWWIQVFPGLLIFLTIVLYNVIGEALRDALDPRLKG